MAHDKRRRVDLAAAGPDSSTRGDYTSSIYLLQSVRRGQFGIMLQTLPVSTPVEASVREASCERCAGAHLNLPQKEQVMAFMLVRSKVRDFKTWKPAYRRSFASAQQRQPHGEVPVS